MCGIFVAFKNILISAPFDFAPYICNSEKCIRPETAHTLTCGLKSQIWATFMCVFGVRACVCVDGLKGVFTAEISRVIITSARVSSGEKRHS